MVLPPSQILLAAGIFSASCIGLRLRRRDAISAASVCCARVVDDDGTEQIRGLGIHQHDAADHTALAAAPKTQPLVDRPAHGRNSFDHVRLAIPRAGIQSGLSRPFANAH